MQEFPEYIIREPGSVYARDFAVSNADVMNITAKVLQADTKYDKDEVSPLPWKQDVPWVHGKYLF